jgi:hypothetical protein
MDGVDQAGQQDIGSLAGIGEEATNQVGSALFFDLPGGEMSGIDERAVLLFALQEPFFEEAIEGRHHSGIGQHCAETLRYLLYIGTALRPEHRQDLSLPPTKSAG